MLEGLEHCDGVPAGAAPLWGMTGDPHLAAGIYARHWEGGGTAAAALGEEGQWGKPEEEDEEASDLHSRGLRFFLFNLKRREKEEKKIKRKDQSRH